jgi:hypothetical protein
MCGVREGSQQVKTMLLGKDKRTKGVVEEER